VGSSLLVHDWSSLALGAARAYELEAVKRVSVNFFCSHRKVLFVNTQSERSKRKLSTHPEQHFHIRVTLDVDRVQVDYTLLLQLVRVSVHVQVRSERQGASREYDVSRGSASVKKLPSEHKPPPLPGIEVRVQ
jgi:hypothetical protein